MDDINQTSSTVEVRTDLGTTQMTYWSDVSSFKIWLTSVITSCLFLVISVYILVRLLINARRNAIYDDGSWQVLPGERYWSGAMSVCRITSVTCGVVVFVEDLFVRIAVDHFMPDLCHASKVTKVVAMSVGFISTYTVMWVRQKMAYDKSTARSLRDDNSRMVSALVPILLVGTSISYCLSYVLVTTFGMIEAGCAIEKLQVPTRQPWIIACVIFAMMQLLLLWLFHQPLRKNELSKDDVLGDLKPILQRGFYTTLGCSVSDSVGSALAVTSKFEDGVKLSLVNNISVFINVMMVTVSYITWKETILFRGSVADDSAGE